MAQAKKKTSKNDGNDLLVAAEIGAGILAAAGAAAAGYYFYASEDAPKNRRKSAKWASEMKDKVIKEAKKEMKTVAKLDKRAMAVIVDRAAAAYEGVRNVKSDDLMRAASELKQNWKEIEAELQNAAAKGSNVAKDVAKKGSKAVTKATKTATASPRRALKKVVKAAKAAPKKAVKKSATKR